MAFLRSAWGFSRRHAKAVIAVGLVVVVAGFLWFRPDRLFVDEVVDEEVPVAAALPTPSEREAADNDDDSDAASSEPSVIAAGSFVSHNRYTTEGEARVIDPGDGRRVLRFEDFSTDNGPDLRVYLSGASSGEQGGALADDFVELGPLKGNIGNQNYGIPAGVDLDSYSTVVIWCVRFTVSFGAAELMT